MPAVLFICTANRFRSPIAAAAFRKKLGDEGMASEWRVDSAGTWTTPGLPAVPEAVLTAHELGLNIEEHVTKLVNGLDLQQFNLILAMEAGHKEAIVSEFPQVHERVFMLSYVVGGISYDIPDPMAAEEDMTREITTEVCDLVWKGFSEICQLARRLSLSRI